MTLTQSVQLWAGLGFSAVLVVFFMVAFFKKGPWQFAQWLLIRVLASLCAAFAAALFTGTALVDYKQSIGEPASSPSRCGRIRALLHCLVFLSEVRIWAGANRWKYCTAGWNDVQGSGETSCIEES